jgi:hypothetical protein
MISKDDIEGFLDRLSVDGGSYKEVQPGLWVVKPGGSLDFDMVVHYSPPVAILRVKVIDLPKDAKAIAELSRRLLEMNASDMVHGSYGIEQNAVVITEALELSDLDYAEFLAAYESITLALTSHLREIGSFGARTGGTRSNDRKPANRQKNGRVKASAPVRKNSAAVRGGRKRRGR